MSRRSVTALLACVVLLLAAAVTTQAVRVGLKQRLSRGHLSARSHHISSSDPANNPLSAAAFLAGGADAGPLVNSWQNAVSAPRMQQLDQQVLLQSQAQYASAHDAQDASFLDNSPNPNQASQVTDGVAAGHFEPGQWPNPAITPNPYKHLVHTQGGMGRPVPHNKLTGGLGVQSAALPWDVRTYSGNLNSHRQAEPLIYTPLVIAKSANGDSAIDLTSLANQKYQSQRLSSNPQYETTLSALTAYAKVPLSPTDHWLPQVPTSAAPGAPRKDYEKHFLDLFAPTPPPLLAPRVPRMPKTRAQRAEMWARQAALAEMQSTVLPSVLSGGEKVRSIITPVLDAQARPVAFHDQAAEDEQWKNNLKVDIFAPSGQQ